MRDVEDAVRGRATALATAESARRRGRRPRPPAPSRRLRPPGLLELEELLSEHLDTRVRVTMGAERGKVVIDFADLEDLERIYRLDDDRAEGRR